MRVEAYTRTNLRLETMTARQLSCTRWRQPSAKGHTALLPRETRKTTVKSHCKGQTTSNYRRGNVEKQRRKRFRAGLRTIRSAGTQRIQSRDGSFEPKQRDPLEFRPFLHSYLYTARAAFRGAITFRPRIGRGVLRRRSPPASPRLFRSRAFRRPYGS